MGLSAQIDSWFTAHRDGIIGWRRHLHANPEVSHHEVETTAFIAQTLRDHGLEPHLFPETGLYLSLIHI